MTKRYRTVKGKFQYQRTKRMCAKCGKKKKIQEDTTLCDACILDLYAEGITAKEWEENHGEHHSS